MNRKATLMSMALLLAGVAGRDGMAFAATFQTAMLQQVSENCRGVIKDTKGQPVIGATVMWKSTKKGIITDADGRFSLPVDGQNGTVLRISCVGFQTKEITWTGGPVNVVLEDNSKALGELVVVGYGVQKKVNLSGAVATVDGKVLDNRPITNINQGLQGLAPNLNISLGSGRATDAPSLNVRGFTSINGGDAFILVDNVPVSSTELSRINPNDIENISVLKDASAAAIYGARAAFGVVLITTKRAKENKLQVNANAYYGLRTRGKHPAYITDPVTVMEMKNEAARPLYSAVFSQAQIDYAKKMKEDPSLPVVAINPDNPNQWMYYGSTDWQDEAYRNTASTYSADFNISKKDDKLSYYVSGNYYQEDGLLRYGNDRLKRFNFRTNADLKLTQWWKAGMNVAYTNSNYDSPSFIDGIFFHQVNRKPSLSVPKNPDGTWTQDGASILGALQEGGRSNNLTNETQVSVTSRFELIKNVWTVNADANFRFTNSNESGYNLRVPYRTGPNQPIQYSLDERGSNEYAEFGARDTRYSVYNVYTNFVKTFAQKHFFNAMVGYNRELTDYRYDYSQKTKLISSSLPEINLATGDATTTNTRYQLALEGYFGRLNYIYDERYIFELDGRYDGSSRFPKGNRWGFFPSGSAAWAVGNEHFFETIKDALSVSNLKIRASYGSLGNQVMSGYYPSYPTMSTNKYSGILEGEQPIYVTMPGLVSPSFTWETVNTINFGVDLGLWNNRLTASFDVYRRDTKNMLTQMKELPGVLGATPPLANAANLKTKGWELSVQWQDEFSLLHSPFRYSIKLNLADSRTWITKYENSTNATDVDGNIVKGPDGNPIHTSSLSSYYKGMEIGEIWGLVNDGVFQNEAELKALDQSAVGTDDQSYKFYVGDTKYKDLNGDGKITYPKSLYNTGDGKIIGNSSIRFPYSILADASWKGFDLSLFFQGVGKRDWYPGAGNFYFWGIYAQPWTNVTEKNMDHWTPEHPDAYFPRVKAYSAEDNNELGYPQTKYLQNASYLRLKNLTFGYTLPLSLTKKWGISRLRFYFSGENIFTISHLAVNLDPEVSTTSSDGKVYPMQKTFSFGVNIGF